MGGVVSVACQGFLVREACVGVLVGGAGFLLSDGESSRNRLSASSVFISKSLRKRQRFRKQPTSCLKHTLSSTKRAT